DLTGRQLLHELPLPALAAGGVLLLVFVASVTLCLRPAPWLSAAALGSALVALHAAPIALGREPRAVDGALYARTAGFVADAVGRRAAVPRPAVAAVRVRGRRAAVVGEALGGAVSRRGGRLGGAGRARAGRARPARRPRPARAGVPCRGGLGAAGPRAPAAPPAPPPVPPGRIRRRSARQKTAVRPVRGLNTPSEPNRQGG